VQWRADDTAGLKALAPLSITEKVIIKAILHNSKIHSFIKKNVCAEDFSFALARKAIDFLFKNCPQDTDTLAGFLSKIEDPSLSSFLCQVAMDENIPLDKDVVKGSIMKLRKRRTTQLKEGLKAQIKQAEAQGDRGKLKTLIGQYGKLRAT